MTKISSLPEEVQKFIRKLIRVHCLKNEIYKKAHEHGIGLDETELTIEKLIDKKQLVIETDDHPSNPSFWITPV